MAARHTNTVYDFELFETKPIKAQPTLNVIKNQKYQKRDRMVTIKVVSSIAVVVAVICLMVYSRAQLTELTYQIGNFNKEYSQLQSEYTRISAEVEGKVSLRGVEESAKELGLSKVQPYQVEYVDLGEGDSFENAAEVQEEPTITDKISLHIQSFLEYIKIR